MHKSAITTDYLLSLPLELRNLIYLEVARAFVLNVSVHGRQLLLNDSCISNTCCAMHSQTSVSNATSLALVSRQIAWESQQIVFHRTRSPVSVYFSSVGTLSDFERHSELYQPACLRDFCLSSAQTIMVKSPSAWLALPLPGDCFRAMRFLEVTGIAANAHDVDVLRMSLKWEGWEKEEQLSSGRAWVFLRSE